MQMIPEVTLQCQYCSAVANRVLHATSDSSVTQSSKYTAHIYIFSVDEQNVELFHSKKPSDKVNLANLIFLRTFVNRFQPHGMMSTFLEGYDPCVYSGGNLLR